MMVPPATLVHAAELVIAAQAGSIALLQRKMPIDLTAAGTVMDRLEQLGVVGPFEAGMTAREVLVRPDDEITALKAIANGRRYEPLTAAVKVAQGFVKAQLPAEMITPKLGEPGEEADGQVDTAKIVDDIARRVVEAFLSAGWRPTHT